MFWGFRLRLEAMLKGLAFSVIANFKGGWVFCLKLFDYVDGFFALYQILKTRIMIAMKN
jgi:hypothetical protein